MVPRSSVATGTQGGTPHTIDRHGHRIRANPRFFGKGVGGSDSSPTSPS